jgi:hypothetical protein
MKRVGFLVKRERKWLFLGDSFACRKVGGNGEGGGKEEIRTLFPFKPYKNWKGK